jgi:hypothetical protein
VRGLTTPDAVNRLMTELGRIASEPLDVYFTGGVTAILHGWRATTVDVDLKLVPSSDEVLRGIVVLKESLRVNIELAAPDEFIPELPGWRERSIFIRREGTVSFFHYDLYAQALSKIERGHAQDEIDVAQMIRSGLVERGQLREWFDRIEPELYRFPAIDPDSFRASVDSITA